MKGTLTLRGPSKISVFKTKSTVLSVSATRSDEMNTLGTDLVGEMNRIEINGKSKNRQIEKMDRRIRNGKVVVIKYVIPDDTHE